MQDSKSGLLSIASMVAFCILSATAFLVLPLLVGAWVDVAGLTTKQAGIVAAAEMLATSLSALAVSFVIPRGNWRSFLVAGLFILTVANVLSGLADAFTSIFVSRAVAGLGEGLILSVANASIGETTNPDRVFGLSSAGQLAYGFPGLYVTPMLLAAYGLRGVFWSLAGLTVIGFALVKHMPDYATQRAASGETLPAADQRDRKLRGQSTLGLGGLFVYFIGQGGVWAYLDRMAVADQISTANVGMALALSSFAGLVGASLSAWLDIRFGRLKPIFYAALVATVSLFILNENVTLVVFTAMVSLLNGAWNFSVPYQMGVLAHIDESRRTVGLGGVAIYGGLTLGPAIAAAAITGDTFHSVNWLGISCCLLSLAMFAGLLQPLERAPRMPRTSDGIGLLEAERSPADLRKAEHIRRRRSDETR